MSLSTEELAAISSQVASAMKAAAPAAAPISFATTAPGPGMLPAGSFGAPAPAAAPMWPAGAMPSAQPTPTGIAVKLTVSLPDGSEAPVDLTFGPEYANPAALQSLLSHLVASGWPVKTYRPRQQFGGGGWGGGNGGGGGYNGGNRFGRRF